LSIEFDIFSDNEEKKGGKKRKSKTSSRKLWSSNVLSIIY
jgi:hypothetical protein